MDSYFLSLAPQPDNYLSPGPGTAVPAHWAVPGHGSFPSLPGSSIPALQPWSPPLQPGQPFWAASPEVLPHVAPSPIPSDPSPFTSVILSGAAQGAGVTARHSPGDPLEVRVEGDCLVIGNAIISFMRTLRIPDNGKEHPLPPGLGLFPLRRVRDALGQVPSSWGEDDIFLPMYQREAMWLSFRGAHWRPNALKVGVGGINALSGKPWSEALSAPKGGVQDYLVIPEQPWLDGINGGRKQGVIKQFVAMPLGLGYTVEGQITGQERIGGLQLCVFEPCAGRFPDSEPPRPAGGGSLVSGQRTLMGSQWGGTSSMMGQTMMLSAHGDGLGTQCCAAQADRDFTAVFGRRRGRSEPAQPSRELGLGAGGCMTQRLHADSHGLEAWDADERLAVSVHLVNSEMWEELTGEPMPDTPVTAQEYAKQGLPWFDLYDEGVAQVKGSRALRGVRSVAEMDDERGVTGEQDDTPVDIPEAQVIKIGAPEAKPKAPRQRKAASRSKGKSPARQGAKAKVASP